MAWHRQPKATTAFDGLGLSDKPPAESGATKASRARSSDKPWKVAERTAAKWLRDHDGVDPQTAHVATSTGRVGNLTHLQYDVSSAHYKGEVKRSLTQMPKPLIRTWKQIVVIADGQPGYEPVAFLFPSGDDEDCYYTSRGRRRRLPPMHGLTPEHHAELLAARDRGEALRAYLLDKGLLDDFTRRHPAV